jgi:hypothetical protein
MGSRSDGAHFSWGACKRGQRAFYKGPSKKLKTLKLAICLFWNFNFEFDFKSISPNDTQFLINKHKNRGRFLFTGAPVKSLLPPFRLSL